MKPKHQDAKAKVPPINPGRTLRYVQQFCAKRTCVPTMYEIGGVRYVI